MTLARNPAVAPAVYSDQTRRTARSERWLAGLCAAPGAHPVAPGARARTRTRLVRGLREWPVQFARRVCTGALLGLSSWAAVGCVSSKPTTHSITIQGFQYLPGSLTVQAGDTITWTNTDIVPHTATAQGDDLDSRSIESRQGWRFVAARTGTYRYVCAFHPAMRGTLVVR